MLKLILKASLVFSLTSVSTPPNTFYLFRQYSTLPSNPKILKSLKPLKIYDSIHWPTRQKQMLKDLTGQGGIILFLSKKTSLYAIEGSKELAPYLTELLNKSILTYLASIHVPKSAKKKQITTHYQELLHQGWKDYDLYWLEAWDSNKTSPTEERLAYYHAKYQPKLNLMRYVALTNGEIEAVYQWNNFKTEEEMLAKSQKKASAKPLLTYRIDDKSPLDKLKAKVYYENKDKTGVYRWINRINKQSYIGSSLNLGQILYALQLDKITTNSKDYPLKQAFQEPGLTSFNLQILAYCNIEELAEKEAYYLNLYNISQENKEDGLIIDNSLNKQLVLFEPPKQSLITSNHPQSFSLTLFKVKPVHLLIRERPVPIVKVKPKKTWTLSEATRLKQSLARQKRTKHPKPGYAVQVLDLSNNSTLVYSSIREASRALNIHDQTISNYLNRKQTKPYKKRYIFAKV